MEKTQSKPRWKQCDSCIGGGWIYDESEKKYRHCQDCGGKGSYIVKKKEARP
jgi:DnaJ-class molecular chaperone